MLLFEIESNSNLVLDITINGQKLEFKSILLINKEDYILIEPVRVNGKVVTFDVSGIAIDLMYMREEKIPVVWKNVAIQVVFMDGKTYYKISTPNHGFEVNRRNAFRLFIGLNGVAQMGANRKAVDVIVKDVSETGFSFVSQEDMRDALNTPIHLVFNDEDKSLNLNGIMKRGENVEEKKYVYGCSLIQKNQNLNQYINIKQREILAKQRNMPMSKNAPQKISPSQKKQQEMKKAAHALKARKMALEFEAELSNKKDAK